MYNNIIRKCPAVGELVADDGRQELRDVRAPVEADEGAEVPALPFPAGQDAWLAGEAAEVLLAPELTVVAERDAEPEAERQLQAEILAVEPAFDIDARIAEREAARRLDRRSRRWRIGIGEVLAVPI